VPSGWLSLSECGPDATPAEVDVSSWRRIFTVLAGDSMPIAGTLLVIFLSQTITLAFVGHQLGTKLQAAYAIAVSIFNVSGMSVAIGFLAGLDTLCSQYYGRDPTGRDLPLYVHRGIILALLMALPIVAVFYSLEPTLVHYFGDDVGVPAAQFLRSMPVYLVSNSIWEAYQKGLQSHQAQSLSMASSIMALTAAPFVNMAFTRPEYGIFGAAAALTITNVIGATTIVILAVWHPKSKLGHLPPTPADGTSYLTRLLSLEEAVRFVRIGIPSMVLVCAEWWSLEVLLVFVSTMGTVQAAAFASLINIIVVLWAAPTGTAISASVRLGNALGANLPAVAETWRRVALIANAGIAVADAAILMLTVQWLPHLYTNDEKVVTIFIGMAPYVALMHGCDAMLTAVQNTYRGAGKQALGAKFCIVSLWAIGVPGAFLAASLAPHEFRANAAVLGYTSGFVVMVLASALEFRRWDWTALAAEASAKPSDDCVV
jgi:multidrug resistance protein, MATE family